MMQDMAWDVIQIKGEDRTRDFIKVMIKTWTLEIIQIKGQDRTRTGLY
jgi:hypothetical protein